MIKNIISSKRFWYASLGIGSCFVILFSIIEHGMQFGFWSFEKFLMTKIYYGQWKRYLVSRVVGGLIYGMIMTYYFQYVRKTRERKSA